MEPRNRRFSRVPTRSAHAAGHTVDAVLARRRRTRRGRRPLAGVETRCAAPGRPCLWPDEQSPGPHGAPTGHDREGRGQGVGPLQSTRGSLRTKVAPRDRRSRGRAGSGPRGTWRRKPGAGPSAGVSCHRRSAAYGRPLWGPARQTRGRSPVRECRTPGSGRAATRRRTRSWYDVETKDLTCCAASRPLPSQAARAP